MPTAPGFADCSIEFTYAGFPRKSYVTLGVNPSDTDPLLVGTDVAEAMATTGSALDIIDSQVTMTGVYVAMGTDGGEDLHGFVPRSDAGRASGVGSPNNCAFLVHKRTARGGRRGRGRIYWPWSVQESNVDENGVILAANVTLVQGKMNTFLTALNTNGTPMVLLHSPGMTAEGPPNDVTSLQADGIIGTQRRRLGR